MELEKRDMKMTRTILLLVATHCICNIPMLICQSLFFYDIMSFSDGRNTLTWLLLLILYLTQPALNFFIYAGSNDQYRLAYRDFWRYITIRRDVILLPNTTKGNSSKGVITKTGNTHSSNTKTMSNEDTQKRFWQPLLIVYAHFILSIIRITIIRKQNMNRIIVTIP